MTLFFGLLLWVLSNIPCSIEGDRACISFSWLFIMGYTITFATLYAKLRRINKLFHNPQFQRIKVEAKDDVFLPFVILFTINFILMLCWMILDPPKWQSEPIESEWDVYPSCSNMGEMGELLNLGTEIVFVAAFLMVCWQAWRARWISDEFSESKSLG